VKICSQDHDRLCGIELAWDMFSQVVMSVVRLIGFATLPCGCVVGRYRDLASTREVVYVEEKGSGCEAHAHRRNHTVSAERERLEALGLATVTARAS
jgi:hypothetical protein